MATNRIYFISSDGQTVYWFDPNDSANERVALAPSGAEIWRTKGARFVMLLSKTASQEVSPLDIVQLLGPDHASLDAAFWAKWEG